MWGNGQVALLNSFELLSDNNGFHQITVLAMLQGHFFFFLFHISIRR